MLYVRSGIRWDEIGLGLRILSAFYGDLCCLWERKEECVTSGIFCSSTTIHRGSALTNAFRIGMATSRMELAGVRGHFVNPNGILKRAATGVNERTGRLQGG